MFSGVSTFLGSGAGSATSKSVFHRTRPTVSSRSWDHAEKSTVGKKGSIQVKEIKKISKLNEHEQKKNEN